jgi:hypothetical protein
MGWHTAVGVFLVLHGLVHPGIYGPPPGPDSPWETSRSWLLAGLSLSGRRALAIAWATLTAGIYLLAGIALLAAAGWWAPAAIAASVISLALLISYFHPWLSFGVAIDAAIIWAALASWPQ